MSEKTQNALYRSNNPYLLQHADNPVHWKLWETETFERATREQKPLFISIGYSTCHWCHVMARESFEDEEVANLLNRVCIPIKVDREERPDIDSFYMDIALKMNGAGGWPLTIIATPEGKPFFTATYISKQGMPGRAGLMDLLPEIERLWQDEREKVLHSANSIMNAVQNTKNTEIPEGPVVDSVIQYDLPDIDELIQLLEKSFDSQAGGFGTAPKFPQAHLLSFLLQHAHRSEAHSDKLQLVEQTLKSMRAGGIYDQIGFGFHRYATDRYWQVPHFEKMLYDQAQLLLLYTDAYAATQRREYRSTAEEIVQFTVDKLESWEGAFYSALDAESEGREGLFYLWKYDELSGLLSEPEKEILNVFNVEPDGNWRDPVSGTNETSNILYANSIESAQKPVENWDAVREKLYEHRELRTHPGTDDKILTSWNAMMIRALARAARVFEKEQFFAAATRTAEFLFSTMQTADGTLLHSYRGGVAKVKGQLEDYAFFISGLIELYFYNFQIMYLQSAISLMNTALNEFEDTSAGGFFVANGGGEPLPLNTKSVYDGAIPSSYSIMIENLELLFRMTGTIGYRDAALQAVKAHNEELKAAPTACCIVINSTHRLFAEHAREIVIAGEGDEAQRMLLALRKNYLPEIVVLHKTDSNADALAEVAPFTKTLTAQTPTSVAAYVCSGFTCERPVQTAHELIKLLTVST